MFQIGRGLDSVESRVKLNESEDDDWLLYDLAPQRFAFIGDSQMRFQYLTSSGTGTMR